MRGCPASRLMQPGAEAGAQIQSATDEASGTGRFVRWVPLARGSCRRCRNGLQFAHPWRDFRGKKFEASSVCIGILEVVEAHREQDAEAARGLVVGGQALDDRVGRADQPDVSGEVVGVYLLQDESSIRSSESSPPSCGLLACSHRSRTSEQVASVTVTIRQSPSARYVLPPGKAASVQ